MSKQPITPTDDHDLMRRIVAGDERAFKAFYLDYFPRLYRFVLRITRRPETVEELIQDTLMVVWEKPESFNFSCKLSTWVFGIAYRKALKSMAKNSRHDGALDIDEMSETLADSRPQQVEDLEAANWLESALSLLSPDHRAVLELTFHQGLNYKEIAEIMDCPENTVKTRMFHARKKLQSLAAELK